VLEGTSPDVLIDSGSAGALPSKKTIRYSPFTAVLGSAGASPSQFCPPTEVGVYWNEAC